jgi:hypothetical protein
MSLNTLFLLCKRLSYWLLLFYHKKNSFTSSKINDFLPEVNLMPLNLSKQKKRSMIDIKLFGIVLLFAESALSFVIHHCSYRVNT